MPTELNFNVWVDSLESGELENGSTLYISNDSDPYKTSGSSLKDYCTDGLNLQDIVCSLPIGNRLTLESGVPISTTDQTNKNTIYWTPYNGNRFRLWDGSAWKLYNLSQEKSVVISGLTASKCYDVFAYVEGETIYIDLGPAWTNDDVRSLAITSYGGTYVNNAEFTSIINSHVVGQYRGLHIGTIYTTDTNKTEDSASKRYVANTYNRVKRKLLKVEATQNWNYSTASYRQANNSTNNQVNWVSSVTDFIQLYSLSEFYNSTSTIRNCVTGIGINSTSTNSAQLLCEASGSSTIKGVTRADYFDKVSAGRGYGAWLEKGNGTDTQTWIGGDGGSVEWGQRGIGGWITL